MFSRRMNCIDEAGLDTGLASGLLAWRSGHLQYRISRVWWTVRFLQRRSSNFESAPAPSLTPPL